MIENILFILIFNNLQFFENEDLEGNIKKKNISYKQYNI